MSTRVLIVDDHAVVRSGLRLLLDAEEDIEPVGEAGSARDAVFQARALKPDVILLDIVMPEQSGLDVLPQLKHENPDAHVLVLSMQDEPRYVREAFAAGASGYVLKEAADNEVVAAVREVAGGGRYVNPELGARLVAADADAAGRRRRIRSRTASGRYCGCSRSGTRIRRSRSSSTSRSGRPRRTGPTSCRSFGCRLERTWLPTRSTAASSSPSRPLRYLLVRLVEQVMEGAADEARFLDRARGFEALADLEQPSRERGICRDAELLERAAPAERGAAGLPERTGVFWAGLGLSDSPFERAEPCAFCDCHALNRRGWVQRARRGRRGSSLRPFPQPPGMTEGRFAAALSFLRWSRAYATGTAGVSGFVGRRNFTAVSGFRRAPPTARIPNPSPVRRSAIPTTIPNKLS